MPCEGSISIGLKVELHDITISFYQKKVVRDLSHTFGPGTVTAITGDNGSGKSSLVKLIAGMASPSKGAVRYWSGTVAIDKAEVYSHINWVGPYINLYEEFNAEELFRFQSTFKRTALDLEAFLSKCYLAEHLKKRVNFYSSGMR